jgi:hypothetical protein
MRKTSPMIHRRCFNSRKENYNWKTLVKIKRSKIEIDYIIIENEKKGIISL